MKAMTVIDLRAHPNRPLEGASGDALVDGFELAVEALGADATKPNSGLTAFAYLTRRFGPTLKYDKENTLGRWVLSTSQPDVFLTLHPSGSGIAYSVGYLAGAPVRAAHDEILYGESRRWHERYAAWFDARSPMAAPPTNDEVRARENARVEFLLDPNNGATIDAAVGPCPVAPVTKFWRRGSEHQRRVNGALFEALRGLLEPSRVRDVEINLLGVVR